MTQFICRQKNDSPKNQHQEEKGSLKKVTGQLPTSQHDSLEQSLLLVWALPISTTPALTTKSKQGLGKMIK